MIKIVEIKGGLRELQKLQKRRDFPFEKQQSLWGEKSGLGLSEPPIVNIDPGTGNIEILRDSNSATFSRDMTEEQMIAYFDSLD